MRLVCATLLAFFFSILARASSEVTLVLQFDKIYSSDSIDVMKQEVASIVSDSGMKVDWRLLDEVRSSDTFESLVVVHFHGACVLEPSSYVPDERGYYAYTHVSEGAVLPFSEVECGKITSSIAPAMSKAQW